MTLSQAANDWYDRHVDAINEPNRPIPSGRLPGRWGLYVAILWTALSLAVGLLLGPWGFGATALALVLAWGYSAPPFRFKQEGWLGNAVDLLERLAPQRDPFVCLDAVVGSQPAAVGGVGAQLDDGARPRAAGISELGAQEDVQPHAGALGWDSVDLEDGVFVYAGRPYGRSLGRRRSTGFHAPVAAAS